MARVDFTQRADEPELMDADDLPVDRYAAVLRDLVRVNRVTRAAPPTLRWLAQATKGLTHYTLLDVGFGHGDMLRRVARWAHARGQHPQLIGVDLNPRSAPIAQAATDPALGIRYQTGEAADVAAVDGMAPDFVISSLVAHHMADAELAAFLRWMDATARRGWFVNDLHRHPVAWYGYRALAAVMRWDPIVRHDGALSVRRAFVRADWERLLAAAGVDAAAVGIEWALPFRWAVGRVRTVAGS